MPTNRLPGRLLIKGVDDLLDGDGEHLGDLADGLDPDAWVWLPGVDYAAGWRQAQEAAAELNALLAELGVERCHLRAVADTDAQGHGVVRLVGLPYGWRRLELLLTLTRECGGPAAASLDDAA